MNKNRIFYAKYFVYSIFTSYSLILPIRVSYLLKLGMSNESISIFKVIFTISVLLLEIPTGIIADKISRKFSVMSGVLLFSIHSLFYIIFPTFTGFLLAQIILGMSASLISGADTSMLYVYIAENEKNNKYINIKSRIDANAKIFSLCFSMLSSVIFTLNMHLNFIITFIGGIIGFIVVLSLPNDTKESRTEFSVGNYLTHVKKAWRQLTSTKSIVITTLFTSIIFSILIFNFEYYQVIFKNSNIPTMYNGTIYSAFPVIAIIGYKITPWLIKTFGNIKCYLIATLMVAGSFYLITLHHPTALLISIFMQQITFSSWGLIFENDILESVPNHDLKSTFTSINSLVVSFFKAFILLLLTVVLKIVGLGSIYLILMIITLLVFSLFLATKIRGHYVKEN